MRRIVIGLHGQKRNGKTELRNMLLDRLWLHHFTSLAFPYASGFKEILADVYESCTTREHWFGNKKEEPIEALGGKTARELMIKFATDLIRKQFDDNFWVRLNRSKINDWFSEEVTPVKIAIIDDVRFENEAKMIMSYADWRIFRVVNTNIPEVHGNDETEQILGDHFLTGTVRASSLRELGRHADNIIESLHLCSPTSR